MSNYIQPFLWIYITFPHPKLNVGLATFVRKWSPNKLMGRPFFIPVTADMTAIMYSYIEDAETNYLLLTVINRIQESFADLSGNG